MSAAIIPLPERKVQPDADLCLPIVAKCKGDEGELFDLAITSLVVVHSMRGKRRDATAPEMRAVVNALFVAFLALGEMLGIVKD